MAGAALRCPDCTADLRPDRTKMNVVVDLCPHGHGIFLDQGDIVSIVGEETAAQIRALVTQGTQVTGECPNCRHRLNAADVNHVRVRGCTHCGSLWYNNEDLKAHVAEVRKRAYGADSMAARLEVLRDATAFYPAEIVAGILTDFQLELEL